MASCQTDIPESTLKGTAKRCNLGCCYVVWGRNKQAFKTQSARYAEMETIHLWPIYWFNDLRANPVLQVEKKFQSRKLEKLKTLVHLVDGWMQLEKRNWPCSPIYFSWHHIKPMPTKCLFSFSVQYNDCLQRQNMPCEYAHGSKINFAAGMQCWWKWKVASEFQNGDADTYLQITIQDIQFPKQKGQFYTSSANWSGSRADEDEIA